MKITAIRSTPINVPLEAPYRWSYGAFPGFSKSISTPAVVLTGNYPAGLSVTAIPSISISSPSTARQSIPINVLVG